MLTASANTQKYKKFYVSLHTPKLISKYAKYGSQ